MWKRKERGGRGTYDAVAEGLGVDGGDVDVVDQDAAGFGFHFFEGEGLAFIDDFWIRFIQEGKGGKGDLLIARRERARVLLPEPIG